MEKQISHLKNEMDTEKNSSKNKIENLDREKIEMSNKIMRL